MKYVRPTREFLCKLCGKSFNTSHYTQQYCGYSCSSKVKISGRVGKRTSRWKGDKVGYSGIHLWLRFKFGPANACESAKCLKVSKQFDWALLKGKTYKRRRENFIMLCHKCHMIYDKNSLSAF